MSYEDHEQQEEAEQAPPSFSIGNTKMTLGRDHTGEYVKVQEGARAPYYEKVHRNVHGEITHIGDREVQYEKGASGNWKITSLGDEEVVRHKGEIHGIGGPWSNKHTRVSGDAAEFFKRRK